MAVKFLLIAALVSCVRSSIIPLHSAPLTEVKSDYDINPQYAYAYDVADYSTGDIKNQYETRHGDVVQGEYSLIDSDGTKRTVTYNADGNGFNAVVKKEPLPQLANPIVKAELVSSPLSPAHPVPTLVAEPQTAEVVASTNLIPATVVHTPAVAAPVSVISPSHVVAEHVLPSSHVVHHEVVHSPQVVQQHVVPTTHVVQEQVLQQQVVPATHVLQEQVLQQQVVPATHVLQEQVLQQQVVPATHVLQEQVLQHQVVPATHVLQEQVLQHQVIPATQVVQQQVIPAPAQYIETPLHYQIASPQKTVALSSHANYHDLSYQPYHGSFINSLEYNGPYAYEAPYLTRYINKPAPISYAQSDSYNARLVSKVPAPVTYEGPLAYTYAHGLPQYHSPLYSARYTSPYARW